MAATSSVFPSDESVHEFLETQQRAHDFHALTADPGARYDDGEEIDLPPRLQPLIALPSGPGNVVPVRKVSGRKIYHAYIGSSAPPGLRDFAVTAHIVDGRQTHPDVSLDINPSTRQVLENLIAQGLPGKLIRAGARLHQAGCNGCIGMGQAPASGRISLRTVPRNFPGRSGAEDNQVYLCSPETAAASALAGQITDPRDLAVLHPSYVEPKTQLINTTMLTPPRIDGADIPLDIGPNIKPLPEFDDFPDRLDAPVLLKLADNISTDEMQPAAAPSCYHIAATFRKSARSRLPRLVPTFFRRADSQRPSHFLLSSDKIMVRAPVARIHRNNLINFGLLPLVFSDPEDWDRIREGDILLIEHARTALQQDASIQVVNMTRNRSFRAIHCLSEYQIRNRTAATIH